MKCCRNVFSNKVLICQCLTNHYNSTCSESLSQKLLLMPVKEPQQDILHLVPSLPSSSPSPYQLWAPFSCCQYWPFLLGSSSKIIRTQVYLHHLASCFTLLVQWLWLDLLFRSAVSQTVVSEGFTYAGRLIWIQREHEFCVQPPFTCRTVAVEQLGGHSRTAVP